MIGHRLMGTSLLCTGDIAQGRGHYNQALTLYDPAEHRPLATRFGQDVRVAILSYRSWALWFLGYPEAALADAAYGLTEAREIGQAATSMYALLHTSLPHIWCGNYAAANAQTDDLVGFGGRKGRPVLEDGRNVGARSRICHDRQSLGRRSNDQPPVSPRFGQQDQHCGCRCTLSYLARAHADLGQFDDAWRCIGDTMTAVETTKERWFEAEANRIAGEIALMSPSRMQRKRKRVSSARSRSHVNSKPSPGNSAPP